VLGPKADIKKRQTWTAEQKVRALEACTNLFCCNKGKASRYFESISWGISERTLCKWTAAVKDHGSEIFELKRGCKICDDFELELLSRCVVLTIANGAEKDNIAKIVMKGSILFLYELVRIQALELQKADW